MLSRRERDAGRDLSRALTRSATERGAVIAIDPVRDTPWASATFVGTQHAVTVSAEATLSFEAWLAGVEEAELRVPGRSVADLAVVGRKDREGVATVAIEALTIVSQADG